MSQSVLLELSQHLDTSKLSTEKDHCRELHYEEKRVEMKMDVSHFSPLFIRTPTRSSRCGFTTRQAMTSITNTFWYKCPVYGTLFRLNYYRDLFVRNWSLYSSFRGFISHLVSLMCTGLTPASYSVMLNVIARLCGFNTPRRRWNRQHPSREGIKGLFMAFQDP